LRRSASGTADDQRIAARAIALTAWVQCALVGVIVVLMELKPF